MLRRNLAIGFALSAVVACAGIGAMPAVEGADALGEVVVQEVIMSADGTTDAEADSAAATPDPVPVSPEARVRRPVEIADSYLAFWQPLPASTNPATERYLVANRWRADLTVSIQ